MIFIYDLVEYRWLLLPKVHTNALTYSTAAIIDSGDIPIRVIAESFLPISLSEWPQ